MTKVLRHYLLWFLSTIIGNPKIPFLAKNKRRKNRFREDFMIIPKHERRNSEKHRMQLNKAQSFKEISQLIIIEGHANYS